MPTNVIDLVARLKASIDQAEEQKKVKTARGKTMDSNSGQTASIWMALAEATESAPLSENMHIDVYEYIRGIHS